MSIVASRPSWHSCRASPARNRGPVSDRRAALYYRQSLALLRDALPAIRAGGDRQKEAYSLYYLSLGYAALGDRQSALDSCRQALPLFRELRDGVMTDIVEIRIEELSQALKDKRE